MKILIFSFLLSIVGSHEFYSSITNINYTSAEKAFYIDIQLDTEDLEYALNNHFDTKSNLGEDNELKMVDDLLLVYINEHLIIEVKNKALTLELVKKEIDWGHAILYLKSDYSKKKINQLKVKNSLLTDYFEEQSNIVQVKINNDTFSDLLSNNKTSFEKQW